MPRITNRNASTNTNDVDAMNAKYGATALPAGYAAATSFGTKWDYLKQPLLIGTVGHHGVQLKESIDPNDKRKMRLAQVVSIVDEDGAITDVWESASLEDWFARLTPGAEVAVAFQGLRPAKPGQSPMKVFVGSFKGAVPEERPGAIRKEDRKAGAPALAHAAPAAAPAKRGYKRRTA